MAVKSKQIDWGGLDLIVNNILLASKPGGSQTDLTNTDLSALAGVTAGTVTASKALIVDSSKNLATLGTLGMTALTATTGNFSGQVNSLRKVVNNTATATQTLAATDSGTLYILNKADGIVVTLPAPSAGIWFDFVINTTVTSNNYKIITDAGTTFLAGTVIASILATPTLAADTGNGTSHISVLMNGTTTGGYVGTTLRFVCYDATHWTVSGFAPKTGSVATMFSAS